LFKLLSDNDFRVVYGAIIGLIDIGDECISLLIKKFITDPNFASHQYISCIISNLSEDAYNQFATLSDSPSAKIRSAAIDVIGITNQDNALQYVVRHINDRDINCRRICLDILSEKSMQSSVTPLLYQLSSEYELLPELLIALGATQSKEVFDHIISYLHGDNSNQILQAVIISLGLLMDDRGAERIIEFLDSDRMSPYLLPEMINSLARIGSPSSLDGLLEIYKRKITHDTNMISPIYDSKLMKVLNDSLLLDIVILGLNPENTTRVVHELSELMVLDEYHFFLFQLANAKTIDEAKFLYDKMCSMDNYQLVKPLIKLFEHPNYHVQFSASKILGSIGRRGNLHDFSRLYHILRFSSSVDARSGAARALGFANQGYEYMEISLLLEKNEKVKKALIKSISLIESKCIDDCWFSK
jgi:HEAT repeat protein